MASTEESGCECNKGTKRVRGVQPQISVRAAAAERVDNSTTVTLRLFLHRDVTDKFPDGHETHETPLREPQT